MEDWRKELPPQYLRYVDGLCALLTPYMPGYRLTIYHATGSLGDNLVLHFAVDRTVDGVWWRCPIEIAISGHFVLKEPVPAANIAQMLAVRWNDSFAKRDDWTPE
ncbi:MAG: hypothetical protein JW910_09395 [Anaerolineae bacterium]|nr:hypothetical protein [Anaerolineae bacterium]